MAGLLNELIPYPHVGPTKTMGSQIGDHGLSTSCGVVERPDSHCGDDLVFHLTTLHPKRERFWLFNCQSHHFKVRHRCCRYRQFSSSSPPPSSWFHSKLLYNTTPSLTGCDKSASTCNSSEYGHFEEAVLKLDTVVQLLGSPEHQPCSFSKRHLKLNWLIFVSVSKSFVIRKVNARKLFKFS